MESNEENNTNETIKILYLHEKYSKVYYLNDEKISRHQGSILLFFFFCQNMSSFFTFQDLILKIEIM